MTEIFIWVLVIWHPYYPSIKVMETYQACVEMAADRENARCFHLMVPRQ